MPIKRRITAKQYRDYDKEEIFFGSLQHVVEHVRFIKDMLLDINERLEEIEHDRDNEDAKSSFEEIEDSLKYLTDELSQVQDEVMKKADEQSVDELESRIKALEEGDKDEDRVQ